MARWPMRAYRYPTPPWSGEQLVIELDNGVVDGLTAPLGNAIDSAENFPGLYSQTMADVVTPQLFVRPGYASLPNAELAAIAEDDDPSEDWAPYG